jgi:hypothetical protein
MRAHLRGSRNSTKPIPLNKSARRQPGGTMTDREAVSNNLLRKTGALAHQRRGVYTQAQLVRKMASEQARASNAGADLAPEASSGLCDYLFACAVSEIIGEAGLTPLQEACLRLSISGFAVRDIGLALGIGRMRVHRQLKIARHRLRAVYGRYACFGWEDVYWAEVHRQ